jgi:hypothetical protein
MPGAAAQDDSPPAGEVKMHGPGSIGERAIALFLLAFLAFNPPLLSIFSSDQILFGVPLLYLYLFCAWAGVIALIGLHAVSGRRSAEEEPPAPPGGQPGGR